MARKQGGRANTAAQTMPDNATASEGEATGDRITYREVRNTPGRVWKRLANNELLTLVAEGTARMTLAELNAIIRDTRDERRRADR